MEYTITLKADATLTAVVKVTADTPLNAKLLALRESNKAQWSIHAINGRKIDAGVVHTVAKPKGKER